MEDATEGDSVLSLPGFRITISQWSKLIYLFFFSISLPFLLSFCPPLLPQASLIAACHRTSRSARGPPSRRASMRSASAHARSWRSSRSGPTSSATPSARWRPCVPLEPRLPAWPATSRPSRPWCTRSCRCPPPGPPTRSPTAARLARGTRETTTAWDPCCPRHCHPPRPTGGCCCPLHHPHLPLGSCMGRLLPCQPRLIWACR